MSSIVVAGDTSGSITLAAPAVAGSNTLTLPANTGTVITTASSGQSIPKAALPTGSVLQVVNATYATAVTVSSSTWTDSGLTATITPTSSSSKILVLASVYSQSDGSSTNIGGNLRLVRAGTTIWTNGSSGGQYLYVANGTGAQHALNNVVSYLDSPATTSATIYKIQGQVAIGSNFIMQWQSITSNITLLEIAA